MFVGVETLISLTYAVWLQPFTFSSPRRPWATVAVNGVDIVVDLNVPTANGAGSNEDIVVVLANDNIVRLALSDPMVFISDEPSGTMQTRITCARFIAFTSQLPAGISRVAGTGLVAP
jgi:hypothetical protein